MILKKVYRVLLGICESGLSHANLFFSLHFIVLPFSIRHLDISHNTPSLPPPHPPPPKFCVAFVVNSLGYYSRPKKTEDTAHAKFWEENKVYYGRCASGKLCYLIYPNRTHVVCFKSLAPTISVTSILVKFNAKMIGYKLLRQLIRDRIFIFSVKLPSPQMTSSVPWEKTDHLSRQESLILPHPPALLPNHPLDFK